MTTPPHLPGIPTGAAEHRETADADPPFSWAALATGDLAPPPPVAPEAWGPPPPWQPPLATKKRMVWPWFVAGGAVVFVVLVVGVIGFAIDRATADQNANYAGAPIASSDVPATGDYLIVSTSGEVAFEGRDEWHDISDYPDMAALLAGAPPGATIMAAYFTSDPDVISADVPELVLVLEAKEPNTVTSLNVERLHDEILATALTLVESEADVTWQTGPFEVTTANGLEGFKTQAGITMQGIPVVYDWYTFARKDHMVSVQIVHYDGVSSPEPARLILGSLRIDG